MASPHFVFLLAVAVLAAPTAVADPVADAVRLAADTAVQAAGTAAAAAHDASDAASQAAQDGAAMAAGTAQALSDDAAAQVAQAGAGADQAVHDALQTAIHAPDEALTAFWRYYDNAEGVPPLAGDYITGQTSRLDDLDSAILWDLNGTYAPYLEDMATGLQTEVTLDVPIGGEPSLGANLAPPWVPAPGQVVEDTQGFAERTAAHAAAWSVEAAAATEAFANAVVAQLTA